jgi:hypothetical protein
MSYSRTPQDPAKGWCTVTMLIQPIPKVGQSSVAHVIIPNSTWSSAASTSGAPARTSTAPVKPESFASGGSTPPEFPLPGPGNDPRLPCRICGLPVMARFMHAHMIGHKYEDRLYAGDDPAN